MTREELQTVLTSSVGADVETQSQVFARILDENDRILQDAETQRGLVTQQQAAYQNLQKQYLEKFLGAVPNELSPNTNNSNEETNSRMRFADLFK